MTTNSESIGYLAERLAKQWEYHVAKGDLVPGKDGNQYDFVAYMLKLLLGVGGLAADWVEHYDRSGESNG